MRDLSVYTRKEQNKGFITKAKRLSQQVLPSSVKHAMITPQERKRRICTYENETSDTMGVLVHGVVVWFERLYGGGRVFAGQPNGAGGKSEVRNHRLNCFEKDGESP